MVATVVASQWFKVADYNNHILYKYNKYNEVWWPLDKSIFSFFMLLKDNPIAFCFDNS